MILGKNSTLLTFRKQDTNYNTLLFAILLLIVVNVLIIVVAFGGGMRKNTDSDQEIDLSSFDLDRDSEEILNSLTNKILLPSSEPTIAQISDVNAVKELNPTFYKDASSGDILVIYPEIAILYRRSADLIIAVSPIVANQESE